MDKTIVVHFLDKAAKLDTDLEIPADITAKELLTALNQGFGLGIREEDLMSCYVKSENPIALLRGTKTLREYGLRNGSEIRCRD